MDRPDVETLCQTFGHNQLAQAIAIGRTIGFAPVTTASTILQVAAMAMAGVHPGQTAEILRAYADVLDAGPGEGPAQSAARVRFDQAAQTFMATARTTRDFPAPQGRA